MIATKKEAQAALNAARTKAQKANVALFELMRKPLAADDFNHLHREVEVDGANAYYKRCIRELEEAINAYAPYDNEADE